MYVANAHNRSKRIPKNDSPTTAGVGKLPAQTVTNRAELKALGERMGWKVRPLTEKEIKGGMSGQELIWRETFSPSEVQKALAIPNVEKYNAEVRANQENKRMWEEGATDEQHQKAIAAADKFVGLYPQFIRSDSNNQWAVINYMADHNLDATRWESYATAFVALVPLGKIALNPSVIGAGSETEIYDVSKHRNYHLLLQAQRRPSEIDRMSADQFKTAAQNTHPELKDQRVPQIVAARNAKAETTAAHFHQAAEHTNTANVVTLVDYPDQPHGVPPESEKFSFKAKIRSMSATELAERCQLDPVFKKSLDEMK